MLWIVDITMVSLVVWVNQCSFSWSGYGFLVGLHAQLKLASNMHQMAVNFLQPLAPEWPMMLNW